MNISDVLKLSNDSNLKLIAGEKGKDRKVETIEVMEVPQPEEWANSGVLVITTFYSVQNDSEEQLRIVKELIQTGAAGLIVKIGKFIKELSEPIVNLANDHDFPILSLPKEVAYIDILSPLNAQLHMENLKNQDSIKYLKDVQIYMNNWHESVENAVNELSKKLLCSIYIEDEKGRLLYHSNSLVLDGWRDNTLLFSYPSHVQYEEFLKSWSEKVNLKNYFSEMFEQKKHMIVPVYRNQEQLLFIHLVSNRNVVTEYFDTNTIELVKNRILTNMISEYADLQREFFLKEQEWQQFKKKNPTGQFILLYLERSLNEVIYQSTEYSFDYQSLLKKYLKDLLSKIADQKDIYIFQTEKGLFIFLSMTKEMNEPMELKNLVKEIFEQSKVSDMYVAISPIFQKLTDWNDKKFNIVKTLKVGKKIYPNEYIHSYHELGLYEFLIELSSHQPVQLYVKSVLQGLSQSDPVLTETLNMYLKENGNASRAAEKLFVTRRTITYRLQRIKDILGMDLDRAEDIFILQFCLRINHLENI
ncbi:putative transcriptional regulator [Bacillus sp. TS-2]|nr:putative transcriptional regulator [Bacillus sp. TS-2]